MTKFSKSAARTNRREERSRSRNDTPLLLEAMSREIPAKPRVREIKPLTDGQKRYDAAMRSADIVFGIGPAGTGKTWLAAMRAAERLDNREIERIIVTRPAVEAGESLGFLPGELDEKYEPYFRPVSEALVQFFGASHLELLIKSKKIEARPLALLRGASIDNAVVIADEMQNATLTQFKLLLTRGGKGTKFIINGDPRQTDLPGGRSGLTEAQKILGKVKGVEVVTFDRSDIVRSGLTQRVVEAFEDAHVTSGANPAEGRDAASISLAYHFSEFGLGHLLEEVPRLPRAEVVRFGS
ncbi:PhoH family protein [Ancylobacter rudongensis]|uniref:PhoH-like protein n=1 Tax=Ancylobacter rudongensis TaxID=177413 RepID=A0A1G4UQ04_9HYPH|nr:PhoH family protein [Ancylobacter rudongensis]SCW95713.1 PhoH-like protein [Ancylobacter rudongensis]